jgi:hypothetical protein
MRRGSDPTVQTKPAQTQNLHVYQEDSDPAAHRREEETAKTKFFIVIQTKTTTDPQRSLSSLPHLIGN